MRSKVFFLMPCLLAVLGICHRSYSQLFSLFQIPKEAKKQVKNAQPILSPLLNENAPRQRVRFQIMINLFFRH